MARLASSAGHFFQVHAVACLLLCYLLLVVLGAAVFTAVELPLERRLRAELEELRGSFLQENPCVEEGRLTELLHSALSAHRAGGAVLKAAADQPRCHFTTSLYFVIATLTTMGSDSYTPRSDEAKLFCIFYCTLGIPLTLFLLSLLSHLLLPVVSHAPLHHLRTRWGLSHGRAALLHAGLLSALVLSLLFLLPALLVCVLEPSWSFLDALFFCFVTLSTVGQGGNPLGHSWGPAAQEALQLCTACYLLVGLVLMVTFKDTLLQVPQVCVVTRLLTGRQYAELEGFRLGELTLSEDQSEEEPQYSQFFCTISSSQTGPPPHPPTDPPARLQKPPDGHSQAAVGPSA